MAPVACPASDQKPQPLPELERTLPHLLTPGAGAAMAGAGAEAGVHERLVRVHHEAGPAGGLQRYVVVFAGLQFSGFWLAELDALVDMLGIQARYDRRCFSSKNPFFVVDLPSDADLQRILGRAVLIKYGMRLLCLEASWSRAIDFFSAHPLEAELAAEESSFKFEFESFGRKIKAERRQAILEHLSVLRLRGTADMRTPKHVFAVVEDFGTMERGQACDEPSQVMFGLKLGSGQREIIKQFSLKTRAMVGTTSMDPELSLIMSNCGQARPGTLCVDPFVGTGSMLYTSAHFGATVMGWDIDFVTLNGRGKTSRKTKKGSTKFRSRKENIPATIAEYGLQARYLDVLAVDSSRAPFREGPLFDSIITDPPYGIREGAKTITSQDAAGASRVQHHVRAREYDFSKVFLDLLTFSAKHLVCGGRLVYWLPVVRATFDEAQIPRHPCLELLCHCEQVLNRRLSRRLVVMRKVADWTPDLQARAERDADTVPLSVRETLMPRAGGAPPSQPGGVAL